MAYRGLPEIQLVELPAIMIQEKKMKTSVFFKFIIFFKLRTAALFF